MSPSIKNVILGVLIIIVLSWTGASSLDAITSKPCSHDEAFTQLLASGHSVSEIMLANSFRPIGSVGELAAFQDSDSRYSANSDYSLYAEDGTHFPLYYRLVSAAEKLFSGNYLVARRISAVLRIFIPPLVAWLTLEIYGSSLAAIFALVLTYVSPLQMRLGTTARDYPLILILFLLTSIFLLIWIKKKSLASWGAYSAMLLLSCSFSLFSLPLMVAHAAYLYIAGKQNFRVLRFRFFSVCSAALMGYALWFGYQSYRWGLRIPVPKLENEHTSLSYLALSLGKSLVQNFFDLNDGHALLNGRAAVLSFFILFAIAAAFIRAFYERNSRVWFLLILAAINFLPFVLLDALTSGTFYSSDRHTVIFHVVISILVSRLIERHVTSSLRIKSFLGWCSLSVIVGIGLLSCKAVLFSDSWPPRSISGSNRAIINFLNNAPNPLLISNTTGTKLGNLLAMTHELRPEIRLMLAEIKPETLGPIDFKNNRVFVMGSTTNEQLVLKNHGFSVLPAGSLSILNEIIPIKNSSKFTSISEEL